MEAWPPARMKDLGDNSLGGQRNDENILHHSQRNFTPEAFATLERLGQRRDPQGRFEGFPGKSMPTCATSSRHSRES
jgi:hypothetical protein